MVLFPVVSYALMGDFVQDNLTQFFMVMVWVVMAVMVIGMLGLVAQWFVRTRRYFEDNDIFPEWERSLYILAIAITVFEVVATYIALPSNL